MKAITRDGKSSPILLAVNDLANILKLSVRSVWRMRSAGQIPEPLRIGGTVRWRMDDVALWIEQGCPSVEQQGT